MIGALIEVHRALGPGLLESAYEACACRELELRGFGVERQVSVPLVYRGREIDVGFRVDLLVDRVVLIELKAVEALLPVHVAQAVTYMKLAQVRIGLLVNFNVTALHRGLRRITLPLPEKNFTESSGSSGREIGG